MPTYTVPCAECAEVRQRFELRGWQVLGCSPLPGQKALCAVAVQKEPPRQRTSSVRPVLALSPGQARMAKAIVNLFETGDPCGRYSQVTLLSGDAGRLSYGRSQATLGSGSLLALLQRYCANGRARLAGRLSPWLPRIAERDDAVDHDERLHNLLRACADDAVMRSTQDEFFDEAYWQPALRATARLGLSQALSAAVIYDSHVHGSWNALRDLTNVQDGRPEEVGERRWIRNYLARRRAFIAGHRAALLRATVYRVDALQRLTALEQWELDLPLVVRGVELSHETLAGPPGDCHDGPEPGSRGLGPARPLMRGLDVRLVQLGLSERGADIRADGVFGPASALCVKEWQIASGRRVTGELDADTVRELAR